MATTSYGVNDALAVKLWAEELFEDALNATEIAPLIGTSADSIIQRRQETSKGAGDRITVGLRMQLSGDGVTEGEAAEGNEEALTTYSDDLYINELLHSVRVKNNGTIDAQRVPYNLREEAKTGLRDWWAKRMSVSFFNQVCGNTATSGGTAPSSTKYTGLQAALAPSSGRILRPNSHTTDQAVQADNTAVFTLDLVDKAKELAKTTQPMIRPIMVGGKEKWVMYLDPSQVTSMRTNTSTGQWLDIQKAAMAGMDSGRSPIYNGALGEYNGVVLRESVDVPNGVHSSSGAAQTSTRRAVLLGAQAAAIAFGKGRGPTNMKWVEELFDYQRELGVSAQSIWGLKKLRFNSKDFGTIVVTTHAVRVS